MQLLTLSFSLVPEYALWARGIVAALLAALAIVSRGTVAIIRAAALALVLLALANPSLVQEEREKVKDIVAVVIDRSTSQTLGDRPAMTESVRNELQRRSDPSPTWSPVSSKPMTAEATTAPASSRHSRTVLPTSARSPRRRRDGHGRRRARHPGFRPGPRLPGTAARARDRAPHRTDRQIKLLEAPRFGIVGKDQTIRAQVLERGGAAWARWSRCAATVRSSCASRSARGSHSRSRCASIMEARTSSSSTWMAFRTNSPRRTTAQSSPSRASARSCACSSSRESPMRASAHGATFSNPTPTWISSTSPSCAPRKSRTARRSTSCR